MSQGKPSSSEEEGGHSLIQHKGLGVGAGDRKCKLRWVEPHGACSTLGKSRGQRTDTQVHTMVYNLGVIAMHFSFYTCRQTLHAQAWVLTIRHLQADYN